MIDTFVLFLDSFEVPGYDKSFMDKNPLIRNSQPHGKEPYRWFTGHCGNLYLKSNDRGLKVNGSLSGFFYGNNYHSLDVADIRLAFEKLEDSLKFSFKNAIITNADIAQNLELDHAPDLYLSLFGNSQRTKPKRWDETLYYENQNMKKTFYDKSLEMRAGKKSPPGITAKNILRYELRFKKGFQRTFGQLRPDDLSTLDVRKRMIDPWYKGYQVIRKHNKIKMDYSKAETPGEIEKVLLLELISIIGIDGVEERINKRSGADTKNRYESRKRYRELMKDKKHTVYPDLLKELDAKIKEAKESVLSETR